MKMFVGVTDSIQYETLMKSGCDEVCFWTPGGKNFKAIEENELFLFKLHSPDDYIVGGGYFVRYTTLPTYLAWSAFGVKNGTESLEELNARINKYRSRIGVPRDNPTVGCIILAEPFFFERDEWIPVPDNWNPSTVTGKTYSLGDKTGRKLFDRIYEKLGLTSEQTAEKFENYPERHTLGEGAFRVAVTEAYGKRCAVTKGKVLPVLEATYVKPFGEGGTREVRNGLLLRSDLKTLFEAGYITVTPDFMIKVSEKLREDFQGGGEYFKYDGKELPLLPGSMLEQPAAEYLEWHNENVYLG